MHWSSYGFSDAMQGLGMHLWSHSSQESGNETIYSCWLYSVPP